MNLTNKQMEEARRQTRLSRLINALHEHVYVVYEMVAPQKVHSIVSSLPQPTIRMIAVVDNLKDAKQLVSEHPGSQWMLTEQRREEPA